ncbi:MAG: ABC transporter ATP-binding protein [Solirubrobacterales bacterium]
MAAARKTPNRKATGERGRGAKAPALEVRDLSKRYGSRKALDAVSFEARAGELLAVIGPNGAGKTTLLSILAGIVKQDAGSEVRRATPSGGIGWVPQGASVYSSLTVAENLRLFARLERVEDVEAAVERMLEQADLGARRDDPVSELSGGNQQRVNIAIGLLAQPTVLLLDEPSTGLDPRQRARLWEFVLGLAGGGTTVIFSTHHIHEAERYGDRLLVMADGEVLFHGTSRVFHTTVAKEGGRKAADFEEAFVSFLAHRGH